MKTKGPAKILKKEAVTFFLVATTILVAHVAVAQTKGPVISLSQCVSDPASCATTLGIAPAVLTFAELQGKVTNHTGQPIRQTTLAIAWDSAAASTDCQRVTAALLTGVSFTTADNGSYAIQVPDCGEITYTITPTSPNYSWTPANRQITVGTAESTQTYKSGTGQAKNSAQPTYESAAYNAMTAGSKVKKAPLVQAGQTEAGETAPGLESGGKGLSGPGSFGSDRNFAALSTQTGKDTGPLAGTTTPGYAEMEGAVLDSLWRASTGCDSLSNTLAGPSAMELAVCGDKSVSQRMATAQQGRNEFNNIFGTGSSTADGLTSRAAGDRGLPTPTRNSNGTLVLPSSEDTLAYLRGQQSQYADDTTADGTGMSKQEAEEKLSYIGTAIKWTGSVMSRVGKWAGGAYGTAANYAGKGVKAAGKYLEEKMPLLANPGVAYHKGTTAKQDPDNVGDPYKRPDPTKEQTVHYSAAECAAICDSGGSGYTDRQICGCDDPSQGVKNPSATDSGSGTMDMTAVDAKNMRRKKTDPLVHTTGPAVEQEPVAVGDLPKHGGKGPHPDPGQDAKK